jgi:hypothetical protein
MRRKKAHGGSFEAKRVHLAWILAGGVCAALALASGTACAEEHCADVVVEGPLPPGWDASLATLRAQLVAMPGSECRPVTLTIAGEETGVRVVATARDGRRAERIARVPPELVPTVLGLLLAIPAEETPAAPPSEKPATQPPPPTLAPTQVASPLPTAPRPFGLAAGLGAGIRLASPTGVLVLDVEARMDVLLERWLLFATIRSAVISCLGEQGVDCDVYNDVSLGVGVGRRFRAGVSSVDLGLEPSLVVMHMEYDLPSPNEPSGDEDDSVDGTLVALRIDASARLSMPLSDRWSLTLTIDAGVTPQLLASPERLALPAGTPGPLPPPFPAWTGGIRIGASGALF